MNSITKFLMLCVITSLVAISCKKDPESVLVSSIEANGTSFKDGANVKKDLNGSSSATDVALNSTFTVTMDKALKTTSVNTTNVKITSAAGDVVSTVTASGSSITIDPSADLERGTQYTLSLSGLMADDDGPFTAISRTFTTEGKAPAVIPQADNVIAYFNFDNNTEDQTGNYQNGDVRSITYGSDRFGQGNSTASFDGDVSIIEVLGADQMMKNKNFTLSFWVKTNSTGHVDAGGNPASHFVMGLAAFKGFQFEIPGNVGSCKLAMSYEMADGTFQSEDLWFPGDGKNKDNGGWQGWEFTADLTGTGGVPSLLQDKWAHVICTYNATSRKGQMFINGELMKSQDFNLWPDGAPKKTAVGVGYQGAAPSEENILAFGFIKSIDSELWATEPWGSYALPTSNHFKGDLDDVRVFKSSLSAAEAKALYEAEK